MKNKNLAAVLALILGGFGVHKFYLKKHVEGIIYFLLSFLLVSFFLGLIDFLILISMSQEKFDCKFNPSGNRDDIGDVDICSRCAYCNRELTMMTSPSFGGGKLSDGGRVCNSCFSEIANIRPDFGVKSKTDYDSVMVEKILSSSNIRRVRTQTNMSSAEILEADFDEGFAGETDFDWDNDDCLAEDSNQVDLESEDNIDNYEEDVCVREKFID
ncbi:MAG: TM2 domain-containing protein [Marinifilaceae bacterium]|jgi:TM2 domain-containing membrane protein YozV|nr:TM2 domain-containing protein [Marinifilaceae bacterium]